VERIVDKVEVGFERVGNAGIRGDGEALDE